MPLGKPSPSAILCPQPRRKETSHCRVNPRTPWVPNYSIHFFLISQVQVSRAAGKEIPLLLDWLRKMSWGKGRSPSSPVLQSHTISDAYKLFKQWSPQLLCGWEESELSPKDPDLTHSKSYSKVWLSFTSHSPSVSPSSLTTKYPLQRLTFFPAVTPGTACFLLKATQAHFCCCPRNINFQNRTRQVNPVPAECWISDQDSCDWVIQMLLQPSRKRLWKKQLLCS